MKLQEEIKLQLDRVKLIAISALAVWWLTFILLLFFNESVEIERKITTAAFFTIPMLIVVFYGLIRDIKIRMETTNEETPMITRLEVIDFSKEQPRVLTVTADKIEYDLQDEGKTLKLFVNRKEDQ